MKTSIAFIKNKAAFAAYFQKTLANTWSKPMPPSCPTPYEKPNDVPEWVWRQRELYPSHAPSRPSELTPEQKAEAQRLLELLGETGAVTELFQSTHPCRA